MKKGIYAVCLGLFLYIFIGTSQVQFNTIRLEGTTNHVNAVTVAKVYQSVIPGGTVYWDIIDSPGGLSVNGASVATVIWSQHKYRQIKTVFRVRGYCHSMCALLTGLAQRLDTADNTPFLFHTIQVGIFRIHPQTSGPLFDINQAMWGGWMRRVLTVDEYKALLQGRDVVVSGARLKAIINR